MATTDVKLATEVDGIVLHSFHFKYESDDKSLPTEINVTEQSSTIIS